MEETRAIGIPRRHEPATLIEYKVAIGDTVEKDTPLFTYEYRQRIDAEDQSADAVLDKVLKKAADSEGYLRKREYLLSPLSGKVSSLVGSVGGEFKQGDVVLEIVEPCSHAVQFNGLCTLCGKDMTITNYAGDESSRATINMSHDAKGLRVSYEEASRLETETMQRLWRSKKLSLIIDLDQTIIHAFATQDPSFEQWLIENYRGPDGSRGDSLPPDIGAFVLPDGPLRYYIKLRPMLREFLAKISELYEMHIYTMGTRHYAEAVAMAIDPNHEYFKERILSRDESGSMTHKTLRRLFPCDTSMVVALDDRADVWQWSPNLIKVQPYQFFSGVGDINSAMLPPAIALPNSGPRFADSIDALVCDKETKESGGESKQGSDAGESKQDSDTGESKQSNDTGESKQDSDTGESKQDSDTGESKQDSDTGESKQSNDTGDRPRSPQHPQLYDSDDELEHMLKVLTQLHANYYARLTPTRSAPLPDVTDILPEMKRGVLRGITIAFSAVIPIHAGAPPAERSDLWRWAVQFGARCEHDVTRRTTHMVAGKPDTAKVHRARRLLRDKSGRVRKSAPSVVNLSWLLDSMSHWIRLDEAPYLWFPEDRAAQRAGTDGSDALNSDPEESAEEQGAEQPPADVIESLASFAVPDEASARPLPSRVQRLRGATVREDEESSANTTDLEDELTKQEARFSMHEAEVESYLHSLDWDDVERELDEFMNESDSDATASRSPSSANLRQFAMRQALRQRVADNKDAPRAPDGTVHTDSSDLYGDSSSSSGSDSDRRGSSENLRHRAKRRKTAVERKSNLATSHGIMELDDEDSSARSDNAADSPDDASSLSSLRERLAKSAGMDVDPVIPDSDDDDGNAEDNEDDDDDEAHESEFESAADAALFAGPYDDDDADGNESAGGHGEGEEEDDENFDDLINELEDEIESS